MLAQVFVQNDQLELTDPFCCKRGINITDAHPITKTHTKYIVHMYKVITAIAMVFL